MSQNLSVAEIIEAVRNGLNKSDEHQKLTALFKAIEPEWKRLGEQGQLTDEQQAVLQLFRTRLQSLLQQKQKSVESLAAASRQLKQQAQRSAGGPSIAPASVGYLQATGPAPEALLASGAYLAASPAPRQPGAYLEVAAPNLGYLQASASAHAQATAKAAQAVRAVTAVTQAHVKVAQAVHQHRALVSRAVAARHTVSAHVARHVLAAQVCTLHTQRLALAAQAGKLAAAQPGAYLQGEAAAAQVSPEHAQAHQKAIEQITAKLQAHTQAIVNIQQALHSAAGSQK